MMSPTIALETSALIAYLKQEVDEPEIEFLMRLAEDAQLSIRVSGFAWAEESSTKDASERIGTNV